MGAKQSTGSNTPGRVRTLSSSGTHNGAGPHVSVGSTHGAGNRARARSLGSFTSGQAGLHMIPVGNGSGPGAVGGSPDSDSSSDEPGHYSVAHSHGLRSITNSLPVHLFALHGMYIRHHCHSDKSHVWLVSIAKSYSLDSECVVLVT